MSFFPQVTFDPVHDLEAILFVVGKQVWISDEDQTVRTSEGCRDSRKVGPKQRNQDDLAHNWKKVLSWAQKEVLVSKSRRAGLHPLFGLK